MTISNRYTSLLCDILRIQDGEPPLPLDGVRETRETRLPLPINERLAQCIWFDQRFHPELLKLSDGRRLKVIDPGRWNLEAGPDFLGATIQIGDSPTVTGDVEIHLRASEWRNHGHARDPRYNNVILHAVLWEDTASHKAKTLEGRLIPQLLMSPALDSNLEDLHDEIDSDRYPYAVHHHSGMCETFLSAMPLASVHSLLVEAGRHRLHAKARRLLRWSQRDGLEQAFYEGWMESLGYKGNKLSFRKIARHLTLRELDEHRSPSASETAFRFEALLLGFAGLLPTTQMSNWNNTSRQRVKLLWEYWWKWRDRWLDQGLTRADWNFASSRPSNHPQRRLAAAAVFLSDHHAPLKELLRLLQDCPRPLSAFHALESFFVLKKPDRYWDSHFTLGGKTQSAKTALLGSDRIRQIILNSVLPAAIAASWLLKKDGDNKAEALTTHAERIFAVVPPTPSHGTERYMLSKIFMGRREKSSLLLPTALHQQGLIQIFQDFCLNNTTHCQTCQLPKLLKRWQT